MNAGPQKLAGRDGSGSSISSCMEPTKKSFDSGQCVRESHNVGVLAAKGVAVPMNRVVMSLNWQWRDDAKNVLRRKSRRVAAAARA